MNSMTMFIVQRRWEKLSGKKEQQEVEVERSGQVVESLEKMEKVVMAKCVRIRKSGKLWLKEQLEEDEKQ